MCNKRILCIVDVMNAGGAETMLMKLYRQLVTQGIQFDFAVLGDEDGCYDNEILRLGGMIYNISYLRKRRFPLWRLYGVFNFFRKYRYEYVLIPTSRCYRAMYGLMARLSGTKCVAIRSTNSSTCMGKYYDYIEKKVQFIPRISSHIRFAPSKIAGTFLFGDKTNVNILKNGVNLKDYVFSKSIREKKRYELGLGNKFTVVHVGRFSKQKNHIFLLKVFKNILKINGEAMLVLIGTGELWPEIKSQIDKLNIAENVIHLNNRYDVPQILMAMDIMIFPSLFEGMPNVVIESQATGLPCLISDAITCECMITDIVKMLPLADNYEQWANLAWEMGRKSIDRTSYVTLLKHEGYNISDIAEYFKKCMGL